MICPQCGELTPPGPLDFRSCPRDGSDAPSMRPDRAGGSRKPPLPLLAVFGMTLRRRRQRAKLLRR